MKPFQKAISLWSKISYLGIEGADSFREKLVILFLNRFAVITMLLLVVTFFLFLGTEEQNSILIICLSFAAINFLVVYLNYRKRNSLASVIYALVIPTLMIFSSIFVKIILERPFTIEEYIVPRINLTLGIIFSFILLFGNRSRTLFYAALAYNYLLIFGYDLLHNWFDVGLLSNALPNYNQGLVNSTHYISAVLASLLMFFLFHIVMKYEKANTKLLKQLETQNEELNTLVIQRQKTLQLTSVELASKLERIERFTQLVSRNLRGPLTTLKALVTHISKRKRMSKKSASHLDDTVDRVLAVTEDLNHILAIEKSEGIPLKEKVSLSLMIQNLHKEVNSRFPKKKLKLETDLEQDELLTVRTYLKLILENIIGNSIKFGKTNEQVHVTISFDGSKLTIEDNGIGFDFEKYKNKVFEPYQKFHLKSSGVGMGLFYSKLLANQIDASIEIGSQVEKGTEVTITFQ